MQLHLYARPVLLIWRIAPESVQFLDPKSLQCCGLEYCGLQCGGGWRDDCTALRIKTDKSHISDCEPNQ
jgi:hypothetical protein